MAENSVCLSRHTVKIFEKLKCTYARYTENFGLTFNQEIYRPGTAISDASNLCTAVGGDQNKEFRGNASFVRGEGVNMKILLL